MWLPIAANTVSPKGLFGGDWASAGRGWALGRPVDQHLDASVPSPPTGMDYDPRPARLFPNHRNQLEVP